ncbi:MAG: hypothetical protein ACM3RP_11745 [Chitinophagales bacterium]
MFTNTQPRGGRTSAARPALVAGLSLMLLLSGGAPRTAAADLLVTTGETRLTGLLRDEHLALETHGSLLRLPVSAIASLRRLENGEWRVELADRDRLTGVLRQRALAFETSWARLAVPVERLRSLVLQTRPGTVEAQEGLLVDFRNGDELLWVAGGDRPDPAALREPASLLAEPAESRFRVTTPLLSLEVTRGEVSHLAYLTKAEVHRRLAGEPAGGAARPGPALALSAPALLAEPRVAEEPFSGYAFGPGGRLAVAVAVPGEYGEWTGRQLWIYQPDGGKVVLAGPGEASWPAWQPGGQCLAYVFRPFGWSTSDLWLAAADGRWRRTLVIDNASHSSLAWSPDGKRLAYVAEDHRTGASGVWVIDVESGHAQSVLVSNQEYFADLSWSPDGHRLLFTSGLPGRHPRAAVQVLDLTTKTVTTLSGKDERPAERSVNLHPRWSPDGQLIAFSSDRGGSRQIWVVHPDGRGLRALTAGGDPKDYPLWSPDGRTILALSGNGGAGNLVAVPVTGGEPAPVIAGGRLVGPVAWSPDGKRLVFVRQEKNLQLWTATLAAAR